MANWKLIAGVVGGFLTGSSLSYIFTRVHYKKKMIQEVNEFRVSIVNASKRIEEHAAAEKEANDILEATEEQPVEVTKDPVTPAKEVFEPKEIEDYMDYSGPYNGEPIQKISDSVKKKDESRPISGPYSIDPDEYGTIPEYDAIHLTYYSDGVLIDDNDNMIEGYKLDETIGSDFKTHFGEYSDDGAWFRNDDTQCEYEVERSPEPYYGA